MLVYIKGSSFGQYLKVGYNVIARKQRGDEPDDKNDLFTWFGYSKNLETAKKMAAKQVVETEIREFKLQQVEKDN